MEAPASWPSPPATLPPADQLLCPPAPHPHAQAGLLSLLEKNGLTLSSIEKSGLLSLAENLGLISAAADRCVGAASAMWVGEGGRCSRGVHAAVGQVMRGRASEGCGGRGSVGAPPCALSQKLLLAS
jgi:hypothetical protein